MLNKRKTFPTKFLITLFVLFWQILSFSDSFASNTLQLNEENKTYRPGQFLEFFILEKDTVSFDDVKSGKVDHLFKKNQKDGLNFGVQSKTVWIKLKIKNNTKARKWILTSEYPVADDITLYKINDSSINKRVHVGDSIGYKNREIKHNMFAFKISPGENSLYIIKAIGKGSGMNYPLKIQTQDHFIDTKADNDFIHGIYFGTVFVLSLYNLFIFFSTKKIGYLFYSLYVFCLGILSMNLTGFAHVYSPKFLEFALNKSTTFMAGFSSLFLSIFSHHYLVLRETNKMKKLSTCIIGFNFVATFLGILISQVYSVKIMALAIVCTSSSYITIGIIRFFQGLQSAKFYIMAFFCLLSGGIIKVLTVINAVPINFFTMNAVYLGNIIEVLLLSLGLADVINHLLEKTMIAEQNLQEANRTLEDKVKQRTQDLSQALGDISNLLNNMGQSVFTVDKDGIIESPVSLYSKTIFNKDIEGSNIFDTIYKDLDQNSEQYSILNFSLSVIFGTDDLQWLMMKDSFPNKIQYHDENLENLKLLKINYYPLWNENELLTSIMFIVEDITEIEKLEREMKEEKEKSIKNIKILEELAGNKREDLRLFFSTTMEMAIDSLFLVRKVRDSLDFSKNQEDLGNLFRNLHTIKGSSRIYGLSLISPLVHELETNLSECLSSEDPQELLTYNNLSQMIQKLYEIQGQINRYIKAAKEVFNLEFEDDLKFKDDLHNSVKNIELWVSQIPVSNNYLEKDKENGIKILLNDAQTNKRSDLIVENLINISHSVKGLARSMDENEISSKTHHFESGIELLKEAEGVKVDEFIEYFETSLDSIRKSSQQIHFKSSNFSTIQMDIHSWVEIFENFFSLFEIIDDLQKESGQEKQHDMFQFMTILQKKLLDKNLEYLSECIKILHLLMELDKNHLQDRIFYVLSHITNFLSFVSIFDTNFRLTQEKRTSLLNQLTSQSETSNNSGQNEESIISLTLKQIKKRNKLKSFKHLTAKYLNVPENDFFNSFIIISDLSNFGNEIYYEIQNEIHLSEEDLAKKVKHLFPDTEAKNFKAFILDKDWTWIRYSKRNDILKFLKNFIDLEKGNNKIIKPKTYEMLADNYHQFENTFHKKNQDDKNLSLLFHKLLDFPVRFSFNRYHRVVQEIAKNLGKKIDLKITGEQGSMSKALLNTIHDAMIHLIRNSIDHGIEAPEKRITKGKKEKGTIEIIIKSIGENKLQIKVKDDGKGIDINRVCKNAVERDLMSSKKVEDLTNEEKLQLIFLPNLSTKQNVTEISGRGVGLDVVKKTIDSLGANLTIHTKLDEGTEFIIEI